MALQVTSDNIEVTPSMKALVENKILKITDRMVDQPDDLVDLRVVLNKGSAEDTFEVKVSLNLGATTAVGEKTEYTLESALIRAIEDVLRQIEKDKNKKDSENWKAQRDMKAFNVSDDA